MTEVLKLSIGMLEFFLDDFLVLLISPHNFIFLMTLMPFGGSSDSGNSLTRAKTDVKQYIVCPLTFGHNHCNLPFYRHF